MSVSEKVKFAKLAETEKKVQAQKKRVNELSDELNTDHLKVKVAMHFLVLVQRTCKASVCPAPKNCHSAELQMLSAHQTLEFDARIRVYEEVCDRISAVHDPVIDVATGAHQKSGVHILVPSPGVANFARFIQGW